MPALESELFAGVMPFVATAEARSFTRAARLLGVTPSAVSKAISKLEAELGVRLLNRTPRAVTLTHEGTLFYRESHNAIASMRNAQQALSLSRQSPQGLLRVSLPLALGEQVIMPALPRLLAGHPGLTIEATLTDRNVDLNAESVDAVVRIGEARASGLTRRRLPPVRWATVAAPAYLARHGMPTRPDDLVKHNCLHFVLPSGMRQPWRFRAASAPPASPRRVATDGNLASDHPGGLVAATLAGVGMLQAHHYIVAGALAEGRLVELLRDHATPATPMAVMFQPGQAKAPKVRVFIDAMVELLGRDR